MAARTLAIGDIHGCLAALDSLIEVLGPGREDTIVTLGDYIDRGPDSRGVLERLINLAATSRLVPLLGDHEEMLLNAHEDRASRRTWLDCGGVQTLRSYGWTRGERQRSLAEWIPDRHRQFLAGCCPYHETDTHLFVHAGFLPELPMEEQPGLALRWRVTDARTARPHRSGKRAVVGHTAQLRGEVLDLGFLVCIDTNCCRGGWLTALEVETGRIWQVDRDGRPRR
jgi:serine/threonine protein phosphatase 1